ncbi:hypothetical protein H0H92_003390 [Tricholoma furcatifolium]|nr:hypothetical protein H0H92_003390 [Tricholoma furcatifolium]
MSNAADPADALLEAVVFTRVPEYLRNAVCFEALDKRITFSYILIIEQHVKSRKNELKCLVDDATCLVYILLYSDIEQVNLDIMREFYKFVPSFTSSERFLTIGL